MIKRFLYATALAVCATGAFISCNKGKTYAELVAEEQKAIRNYIKAEGIKVLDKFPSDSIFAEKEYYLDENGIYVHIENLGGSRKVKDGEEVLLWFNKYGPLPDKDLSSSNMGLVHPDQFYYNGEYTNARICWVQSLKYVGNGGVVKVIAPHSTGNSNDQSNVKAYAYDLEYVFPWEFEDENTLKRFINSRANSNLGSYYKK